MKKKRKRRLAGPHRSTGQQVKQVRQVKISNVQKRDLTSPHYTVMRFQQLQSRQA
jgi:hypothetical protein